MARSRNIKPSIMDNEALAELEPLVRLLFVYLWMLADREGRLEDRPKRIAAQALPYDRSADVDAMLKELVRARFIVRYRAGDVACIQIVNFAKHQTPHVRESASELPEYGESTTKEVAEHLLGCANASPRSPDSLIPDSLIPDSIDESGPALKRAEPPPAFDGENEKAIPARAVVTLSPQFALPESWGKDAERLGWTPDRILKEAEKYRQFYVEGKGKGTRRGIKGWRQGWSNWLSNAERFAR